MLAERRAIMQVFVTGASGHVASAVIPELLDAGHEVVGLARSDRAVAAVESLGAKPFPGSIDDLDALHDAAAQSDGVIHLAFKHEAVEAGDLEGAMEADRGAKEAMGDALAGTGKPFVSVSGTLMLALAGLDRVGLEADTVPAGPQAEAENVVLALADRGVRSSVVRLPPTVHSSLDHHGYIPALIGAARRKGCAGFVGDGSNRWPSVHTLDAAHLFRVAIESALPRSVMHAVAEEGVPFREIAQAIGRHLSVPAVSVPPEEAQDYFGPLALFVALDNPTSGARTQRAFGWHPTHPGLLDDLDQGHYFEMGSM
jgi:nucleoside-diphosphate-sugar epimerase